MTSNTNPQKKPNQSARLITFGSYRAVWDIEHIEGKVYRGKPLIEKILAKLPGSQSAMDFDFIYFLEEYDDRNDWDRLYHSINFDDSLFGVPFKLVPKEKLLFAYSPPPSTIELPPASLQFGRK